MQTVQSEPCCFTSARCRVQFDRRELAVELVKDVDVMPIDPLESLPPSLLASSGALLLNGRRAINGVPQVRQEHDCGLQPQQADPKKGWCRGVAVHQPKELVACRPCDANARSA